MAAEFDLDDIKRRMQGAIAALKHELGGLRTGRASAALLEPVMVVAYGQAMPINQVATVSVSEARALAVQVWDKNMVGAVDRAIRDANLGLSPTTEGQILRIRIPELNEQRRKELAKIAHKYAEESPRRRAPRAPRRHGNPEKAGQGQDHRARTTRSATRPRCRRPPTPPSARSITRWRPRKRKSCRFNALRGRGLDRYADDAATAAGRWASDGTG